MVIKIFKSFFLIINWKTIVTSIISLISTYLCIHFEIRAHFPIYLLSIAIVFPIVFSIDSAYKRREFALQYYADLKAHALSFYLATRDLVDTNEKNESEEIKTRLKSLFHNISSNFMLAPDDAKEKEHEIYEQMNQLSERLKNFSDGGLNPGLVSRLHQYISKMVISYGIIRNIFYYRTPVTLRAYSKIFIYAFPVLFGPFSASTYQEYTHGIVYIIAVLYSTILVSLDNLQEHIENPFDQVGEDDIRFEVDEFDLSMNKKRLN
ncbi:MAG: bestrophin family ion channel [Salibacteraceae bacterium]